MTNTDWATKDFYKILGVGKDATQAEIKKAYRKLARENHPDSKPGDKAAEERFKAIAEAYDVVGDDAKRKEYDETARDVRRRRPLPRGRRRRWLRRRATSSAATSATSSAACSVAADVARRARTGRARRGADVETDTTISFTDSVEGVTVSLRLTPDAPCPDCSGTGARAGTMPRVCPECEGVGMRAATVGGAFTLNETCPACGGRGLVVDDPCPTCHGSGRGFSNRTISARIPAGVKDGQRIRLRGKGASGEQGGPPGDLYVIVKVAAHPIFGRKGDNLTLKVPIAFHEAALGAEVKVPTLGGAPVTVKIPPGTPNGRTFRVRGKGVRRSDGHSGDLLVTVDVQVPANLTDDGEGRRRDPPRVGVRRRPARRTLRRGQLAMTRPKLPSAPGPEVPVYVISVAAELTGLHPQTLRTYDRIGLVSPGRAGGGGRRYSWRDIELLREVAELTSTGIGLEGVRRILELENQVGALRSRVRELRGAARRGAELAVRSVLSESARGRQPRNLPAVPTSGSSRFVGRGVATDTVTVTLSYR